MILKVLTVLTALTCTLNTSNNVYQQTTADFKNDPLVLPENMNLDTYQTSDGKTHNVLWLPNISAPKMSSDPSLLGTPGYFYKSTMTDPNQHTYAFYESPMELNKGYYDINKDLDNRNDESPLCYLGTTANMLYYWLDQNESFVRQYVNNLANGVYGNDLKLYNVLPYKKDIWDGLFTRPQFSNFNLTVGQSFPGSDLVMKFLGPYYYKKDDGYWCDRVIDFFFNGYNRWEKGEGDLENSEDNFKLDQFGGLFNPVMGKTRYTTRDNIAKYDVAGKLIGQYLLEGRPLGLSFFTKANVGGAHAVTVWGAEYDENNDLKRLFVTDTDDFGNSILASKSNVARGLHSYDVYYDENGLTYLSSASDEVKGGVTVNALFSINTPKEKLDALLNDTAKPGEVEIVNEPKDINLSLNSPNPQPLKVDAKINDGGYIEYKWFMSPNSDGSNAKVASEGHRSEFYPSTKTLGDMYYYCEVSNVKSGFKSTKKTRICKVSTINEPLIDAEVPTINFNPYNPPTYNQYQNPRKISLTASVNDGGTLSYQWYVREDRLSNVGGGAPIKGATSNYVYPNTSRAGKFAYYCEVTNTNPNVNGRPQVSATTFASIVITVNAQDADYLMAVDFSKEFLEASICGYDDYTKADSGKFTSFISKFDALSDAAKVDLKQAHGNQNSQNPIERAIAKYDRIISLYGNDTKNFPDFMVRKGTEYFTQSANSEVVSKANDNTLVLISFIALIAILLGFVLFVKKRKNSI